MQADKEDSSREDSKASNSMAAMGTTAIMGTMGTMEEVLETDGAVETNTIRCKDISTLTTGRDGTIPTTRDFSSRSKSSSRSTMLIVLVNLREKNSLMPTEISAFRWEWPLPITTRKFGRLSNRLTPTGMAESTLRKWSCSSRKFREFSNKEGRDSGEDSNKEAKDGEDSSKAAKDGEDSSNKEAKDGEVKDREWEEDSKAGAIQDRAQDGEAKVGREWEGDSKAGEARAVSKDGEDSKEVASKAGEAKEDKEVKVGDLSPKIILFSITNTK